MMYLVIKNKDGKDVAVNADGTTVHDRDQADLFRKIDAIDIVAQFGGELLPYKDACPIIAIFNRYHFGDKTESRNDLNPIEGETMDNENKEVEVEVEVTGIMVYWGKQDKLGPEGWREQVECNGGHEGITMVTMVTAHEDCDPVDLVIDGAYERDIVIASDDVAIENDRLAAFWRR